MKLLFSFAPKKKNLERTRHQNEYRVIDNLDRKQDIIIHIHIYIYIPKTMKNIYGDCSNLSLGGDVICYWV